MVSLYNCIKYVFGLEKIKFLSCTDAQTNKYFTLLCSSHTIYRAMLNKHMFVLTGFHQFIALFRHFLYSSHCSIGGSLSWSILMPPRVYKSCLISLTVSIKLGGLLLANWEEPATLLLEGS